MLSLDSFHDMRHSSYDIRVFTTLIFYTGERLRMSTDLVFTVIASYGLVEQIKLAKRRAFEVTLHESK